jgi:hypothetical protein
MGRCGRRSHDGDGAADPRPHRYRLQRRTSCRLCRALHSAACLQTRAGCADRRFQEGGLTGVFGTLRHVHSKSAFEVVFVPWAAEFTPFPGRPPVVNEAEIANEVFEARQPPHVSYDRAPKGPRSAFQSARGRREPPWGASADAAVSRPRMMFWSTTSPPNRRYAQYPAR